MTDRSASVSQVLKLQVCPTIPGLGHESIKADLNQYRAEKVGNNSKN